MISNNFLLCLICITIWFLDSTETLKSIIEGKKAGIDEFPYQVSVQVPRHGHDCGGGIIGDRFILTAAHCVLSKRGHFQNYGLYILAGTNDENATETAVNIKVKKVFVPVEFDPTDENNTGDIAVLELNGSLELSRRDNLKRLKLPGPNERENYVGKNALIAGFGWHWVNYSKGNEEEGGKYDGQLRYAVACILNQSQCQRNYPNTDISEKYLCARCKLKPCEFGRRKIRGVCEGDSGGPLVYDGEIVIGVLSRSPNGCNERKKPGIYTRVTDYYTFINNAMKNTPDGTIRSHYLILPTPPSTPRPTFPHQIPPRPPRPINPYPIH